MGNSGYVEIAEGDDEAFVDDLDRQLIPRRVGDNLRAREGGEIDGRENNRLGSVGIEVARVALGS